MKEGKEGMELKKVISVKDIKELVTKGQTVIFLDKGDIVTPSAKDAAIELGVKIEYSCSSPLNVPSNKGGTDFETIYSMVKEMLVASGQLNLEKPLETCFEKERDAGGLLLVNGDTITCDAFDTGNPTEKVGMKDIVNIRESSNMGAGFMSIDHSDFAWKLTYDEFDYIVEGHLNITINGKTYKGKKGDVFYIPKNSDIVWNAPDYCKMFYVTYPANWAELAAMK
jgi:ethanolamine utilization protein EutQ